MFCMITVDNFQAIDTYIDKKLDFLEKRSQVEREFHVELEVIKHARHENLVRFLGYCKEGTHR